MPELLNARRTRPVPRIVPRANPPIDTDKLIVEDDESVDSMYVDEQQTLLKEPLRNSWKPPDGRPFRVMCDVGLFFEDDTDHPFSPDIMLATDFGPTDLHADDHRSYFTWIVGKVPDVVIEIVSFEPNGEDAEKMRKYEFRGIPNYVVYDPLKRLSAEVLRVFRLTRKKYRPNPSCAFPEIGLSLKMWKGVYADWDNTWLRWCDLRGNPIPTGAETSAAAGLRTRAAAEKVNEARRQADEDKRKAQRADRRADQEMQKAEEAQRRVEEATEENRRLLAKLRAAGIEP